MSYVFKFLCLSFLIVGIIIPQTAYSNDLSINSIRIGTHPDKTRMVFDLSKSSDFRVFSLSNPPRIVVDFPTFDWKAAPPQDMAKSSVISVRHGILQDGISRVVVDLKQNSTIKSAFILPSSSNAPNRLVIDFSPASSPHNPSKERVFGTLTTPPPSMQLDSSPTDIIKETALKQATSSATPSPPKPPSPPPVNLKKPIIVIDPGHGGQDPGAIGANGKKEKDVTLATAKELKSQLEGTGRYVVHLTRSTDIFIKLQDRVKIARKHKADLFMSLHADSIDKPGVSGASIYTLSNKASDAQTEKLAARENQADLIAGVDLSHEDKEVANILIDLTMRDTMNQSKFFANNVVKQADNKGIDLLETPHRFAGFAVLKAPDVPSVLIEMGFMSNKKEVDKLSTPEYRKKIALSIVAGVDAYFAKLQKNNQN